MQSTFLPCISVVKIKDQEYWCKICNIHFSGIKQLDNHVKKEEHVEAQKKYGCKNISLKENKEYYCGCCDQMLESRELALKHITEESHMINANLPCISIKPTKDKKYVCRICNVQSASEKDITVHVNGARHKNAQKKYQCKNIVLRDDNLYYCRFCDSAFSSRKLTFEHIKKEKHMAALKALHKEGQSTIERILPVAESTKQPKIELASNSIKQEKLMTALKVSNKEGQTTIKTIPNAAESTKQPKIELGSNSIKEEKDISNGRLPCISIKPLKDKKYFCGICNVQSSGEIDLETHVKGLRHRTAQMVYGCSNILVQKDSKYYCKCCDFTLSGREVASQHIKEEKHMTALKESNKEGQTTIKTIPNVAESTKQPKIELVSNSIKEEKHMTNGHLPCISIKPLKDKKYFCEICNIQSSGEIDLETHVKGLRHRTAQMVYGCNNILVQKDSKYYCKCCDFTLSGREVASQHIKEEKHMTALKESNKKGQTTIKTIPNVAGSTKQPKIELGSYSTEDEKDISNGRLPCISIKPLKDKKYFCEICNVESSGEIDLETHVKGLRHRTAQMVYGCNNILVQKDSKYYCKCCDFTLSGREVASQHIKEEKHMTALKESNKEGQTTIKTIPNVAESTKQPKIELVSNSIKEEKHMTNGHLPCISIKPLKDKKYFCEICNIQSSGEIDLETHVNGLRHRTAQMVYGCNNILVQKDSKYYCKCCDFTLSGREVASQHIKEEKHMTALKESNKEGQTTIKTIPNVAESTKQPKIELVSNSIKEENHMTNGHLPCISIKPLKDKKYFCEICNVQSSGEIDLETHVKGLRHRTAQMVYGCNNILVQKDSKYYCKCCDFTLSGREVASQHIKEEKHMTALKESNKEGQTTIKTIPNVAESTKQPKIELVSNSFKEEKHMTNGHLPCISIKALKDKKYFCEICNIQSSGEIDLETHVKGLRHRTAQMVYGCNNILVQKDSKYYCKCCDFTLSGREVASKHIKEEKHMTALKESNKEGQTTIKTIPNVAESTKQPKIELVSNSIKEEKHMTNGHLPCISIKPLKDKKYFCEICNIQSSGEIDLETHVKGLRHRTAQMVYGCNNILVQKDSKYYCKCCDFTLSGREVASQHIKEEKHMTALKESNKEGQTTIKTIPNVAESTKHPKIELVSNSIKEEKHKSNANLLCISIKLVDMNEYHCRICNVAISSEIDLHNHVNGRRHMAAQNNYGCHNISLKEDNLYYCGWCNCTLKNRKHASDHIVENHMNSVELPCISIIIADINKYHCTICNVDISGEMDLQNHVKDRQHAKIQKDYGCGNVSRKEDNLYYCGCCGYSLTSRKLASEHIKEEKHKSNANLPCISLMLVDTDKYYCRICDMHLSNPAACAGHLNGKQHRQAQKEYGCDQISLKSGNLYYCKRCDCTLENRRLASEHLKEKHKSDANLPCISLTLVDTDKYYCRICDMHLLSPAAFPDHLNGRQHRQAQKEYGCDQISLKSGNLYYCERCDCTLKSRKLASEHIKKEKHMSNANLPCISIKMVDVNKYNCKICNIDTLNKGSLESHVNGRRHIIAQSKYGYDNISLQKGNLYYCGWCDCTLKSRKLASDHLEEKHMSNVDLPCISIMLVDVNKYHCTICNVDILGQIDLGNHVKKRQHAEAQKTYGCDNISCEKYNLYYCGCCDCALTSRKFASEHIKEEKHMSNANLPCISIKLVNANEFHCRICNIAISNKIDLHNHVNGRRHMAAQNNYGCNKISLKEDNLFYCEWCNCTLKSRKLASDHIEEKHMNNVDLPCISIMLVDVNKYRCTICDVNIFSPLDLRNHVKGSKHAELQKDYGCDTISCKEDNLFYCGCCDCVLTSRKLASEHIEEEEHRSNANLPCISTKMVNANKYHCRICNVNSTGRTDLENHVIGARHKNAQKKYGCCNIVLNESNLYYCRCCNSTLSNREDASQHIKEEKHMIAVKLSDKEDHLTTKEIPKIAESTKGPTQPKTVSESSCKNSLCSYILEENTTDSYCAACDRLISGKKNVEAHAKANQHITAVNIFSVNKISPKERYFYYCEYCSCKISGFKNAHQHMEGGRHAMSINESGAGNQEQETIKTIAVKLETTKSHNDFVLTPKVLLYHFLVEIGENFECKVCNTHVTNGKDHIMKNQHKVGLQKFHKNQISFIKNDQYHCKYCSCDIYGFENVHQHIEGYRHAISTSITKSVAENQEQKESNTISIKVETKKPDNVSVFTAEVLLHNFIVKVGENLHCKVCNTDVIKGAHIMENRHQIGLQCFQENTILLKNNCYYCQTCACNIPSHWHVDQHVKGKWHIRLLKLFHQKEELAKQIVANKGKVNIEPNLKTTSCSVGSNLLKTGKQFSKATSKATNGQTRGSKKSRAAQKVSAEKGQMRCSVCNASVEGATNLHIHLAQHFSNDFIASVKDEKSTEEKEVTKTKTTSQFKLTEDINCNETAVKKIERTMNMKKIVMDLDFDANNIYSMEDKSADIKLGMQLCYPMDEQRTYCFVCQMEVKNSMQDYYQHLRTAGHCEYLDEIEKDHSLFDAFPDQFSQLDLALQYMIETEDNFVYCFICHQEFNNIQEHIYEKNHHEGCVQLHAKAKKNFENVKLMDCDWYAIQTYWCVPCMKRFRSEVSFAKHLKRQIHADCMKEKQNKKRKLIFDFCAPCALLWYGYRCTSAYHDDVQTHMWLTRDGHYSSSEIPESAKLLLANPEDYVNKTIKYFDDISAKERAKEATLIRDIEKSVESKFLNAKAYTFGSRVSGLGSPDSDIDVFLDCGNMYDGGSTSMHRILAYMTDVHECLSQEPHLWDVEELLTMCRTPIIRAHHRVTGLSCDISFENGLAVENTLLIKSFNDIFPPCRKMILIIKEWLKLCKLSGSDRITSYAVYWYVIFYLQMESILPSVATLIGMKNKSHIIAGWEVGVTRAFTSTAVEHDFSIKELLIRFFKFYANFDYRHEVACPLLSEVVAKRTFTDPESLPEAMGPYKARVKNSDEAFRIDSVMCIQDPFDLQHNLSKAVSKVYLNRFRKYCSKSLDVLHEF